MEQQACAGSALVVQDTHSFVLKVLDLAITHIQQEATTHPLRPSEEECVARFAQTLQSSIASNNGKHGALNVSSMHQGCRQERDRQEPVPQHDRETSPGVHEDRSKSSISLQENGKISNDVHAPRFEPMKSVETAMLECAQLDQQRSRKLAYAFKFADLNRDGRVGLEELRVFLASIGVPKRVAREFTRRVDQNQDGFVSQEEFVRACEEDDFQDLATTLEDVCARGKEYKTPRDACMLSRHSHFRLAWDAIIVALLFTLAITVPLSIGFDSAALWMHASYMDLVVDCFLLLDVPLNFRTGWYTSDGFEILTARKVARNYLRTWFFFDLVTSLPYRYVGADTSSGPKVLRLLRFGRTLKALKLIKFAALYRTKRYAALWDRLEEWTSRWHLLAQTFTFKLLLSMFLLCHWLACFMAWTLEGCVDACDDEHTKSSVPWQYVTLLYWAVTTVTTVGYGDISPSTLLSRLYAVVAMVIGCAFYGFVIGHIATCLATEGYSDRLYHERMSEVQAWLEFHRFPPDLHRRVRLYFATHLRNKALPDENTILGDLPLELQSLLDDWMVRREVRSNPMLKGLPPGVFNRLARCIHRLTVEEHAHVVENGELGYAMFIVIEGLLLKSFPESDAQPDELLELGDSFGEEVLSCIESRYKYSVQACKPCVLDSIPLGSFKREIPHFPLLIDLMRRNHRHLTHSSANRRRRLPELNDSRVS